MPAFMDQRKERALLDSLQVISKILGKEQDYHAFIEWTAFEEENVAKPSLEEIAKHTPIWIRLLSTPLGRLYDAAYDNGHIDSTEAWKDMARARHIVERTLVRAALPCRLFSVCSHSGYHQTPGDFLA